MYSKYNYLCNSLIKKNEDLQHIIWVLAIFFFILLFRNWYNRYKKIRFEREKLQLQKEVLEHEKQKKAYTLLLKEYETIIQLNDEKQTAIEELQKVLEQQEKFFNKTNLKHQQSLKRQKEEFEHQKKAIEKYAHYKAIDANNTRLGAHFIKNVINHIYLDLEEEVKPIMKFLSLSVHNEKKNQKKLSIAILKKIYELLDYNVAAINRDKVSIKEELLQLENFEKVLEYMKPQAKILLINDLGEKDMETLKIKPTLLFPFLENALKHGNLNDDNSFVTVQLKKTELNQLTYKVENSFEEKFGTKEMSGNSSFGLKALKKLLEVYYPVHNLKHQKTLGETYCSKLTINLS